MTRVLRAAAAVSLVAGVALWGDAVHAYTVLGYIWPQNVVRYYVNPANKDLPEDAVISAIRASADAWTLQTGAPVALSYGGLSSQTTNTNDGVNVVMFRDAAAGSTLATTYTWFSGGRIIDADIVFWDAGAEFFTGTTGCSGGFYVEDVATHEFGHALGLGHSASSAATMYPSVAACSQQNRTLDADDIAALLSIYPPVAQPPAPPAHLRIVVKSGGGSQ
jgi:hypothetical protein